MIIGTAGHIDHGKTSLVKAITGIDADRLREEKERGITIDLGFAYWPQTDGSVIGFVDVPGHERFVHNMLAGAQALDLVLLVIAADDGIMPQTREHLEIIRLLGLKRALVALTKIDRVDADRLAHVTNDIANWLLDTPFAGSAILPISSVSGAGLPELIAALQAEQAALHSRSDERLFRLSVDRCFVLQGAGVVVTGMVLDGVVKVGDEVIVSPSGLTARVRSIHAQNRKSETGRAGDRCAINLAGPDISREKIARGDMIVAPGAHAPTQRIDAALHVASGATKGISQWMSARLHHGTAEVGARLVLLGDDKPLPSQDTRVQLVLDAPIAARVGDAFVLRDVSASRTLGGGVLLDLRAPERKRRSPERLALLDALAQTEPAQALAQILAVSSFVELESFAHDHGASLETVGQWCAQADAFALTLGRQHFGLSFAALHTLEQSLRAALAQFHETNPDLSGTGLERLRLATAARLPAALFRALLRRFVAAGWLVLDGNWVRLATHVVTFSLEEENLWAEIAPKLGGPHRFRPPRVRDIAHELGADEADIRRLMHRHARAGTVDEVAVDHFFLRSTLAEVVELTSGVQATHEGWFAAAQVRDALEGAGGDGVGRKVAIQILEFLDRHGVTIRRGDNRRLNPHRRDLFSNRATSD